MIRTSEFKEYLKKTIRGPDHFYTGMLDKKREKSLGVYNLDAGYGKVPIGGFKCKGFDEKRISLLVHWNRSFTETEDASYEILEDLQNIQRGDLIGQNEVCFVVIETDEPVDVGTDDYGVFERVINLTVYSVNADEFGDGVFIVFDDAIDEKLLTNETGAFLLI